MLATVSDNIMLNVATCIVTSHDLRLVILALVVCLSGVWATLRLIRAETGGAMQRFAWNFLAAVTAGSSIWSTHFIAMLAYQPGVPISFDPVLTIQSLIVSIAGALIALCVTTVAKRWAPVAGGILLGLAISAMHYVGMQAYLLDAYIEWDVRYVVASIIMAAVFSAFSMEIFFNGDSRWRMQAAAASLMIAILALHFTGMAALEVTPLLALGPQNPRAFLAMALAVAFAGFIVTGTGLFAWLIDRETRGASSRRLTFLTLNDALTGLPNRASFTNWLTDKFIGAAAHDEQIAVVVIDLDRFEQINASHGHAAGDKVLRTLADRLSDLVDERHFVARMGGDEFAAVARFSHRNQIDAFVASLRNALLTPVQIDASIDAPQVMLDATFGVAIYPRDAEKADALTTNAYLALARAKTNPLSPVCYYERDTDELRRRQRSLASDLRLSIVRNELELHYQVQKSVCDDAITGFETLLRWTHPVYGPVPPSSFIPIAEETGSILVLGEWVLRTACLEAASWAVPHRIAVNLSPAQLAQPNLPRLVHETLTQSGLSPHRLELELTETTFLRDRQRSLHVLRQIKALGVAISLDDFGTGYSSLETLRSFAFDKIKLDRSFMAEIETDPQARAIIRAVLGLGKDMAIPILAEGVETASQLAFLKGNGCDEAQGYFLGRPVPVAQICRMTHPETASVAQPHPHPLPKLVKGERLDETDGQARSAGRESHPRRAHG